MRRFFTLVCLLCLAVPAGISVVGCSRNPAANYCYGLGYGLKDTAVASITLQPQQTGISLAFGQTQQISTPTAATCKGDKATVTHYTYGTTNTQLVDISPGGVLCAGTWNRNNGGGIADYTICSAPNPLPSTNGLPYGTAYITASASSVTSNPVEIYVHPKVTSVSLAGSTQQPGTTTSGTPACLSQGSVGQLDAQAFYLDGSTSTLLCEPNSTSVPNCSGVLGPLNFVVGTSTIASINATTNQITAEQPGTTTITASIAGSGSSAGYFTTCPPKTIRVTLANGDTTGTISQGVKQNLVTTITDTNGQTITGLSLDYQSTDPIDISVSSAGVVAPSYAGQASVYAVCQPATCNPSPINAIGLGGTGLPISSNPVKITVPGSASDYVWFAAPGQSQYVVPVALLTSTIGSPARLPYVPNSMVLDKSGTSIYFGSAHELMIFNPASNTVGKQDANVPGVVLAASPDGTQLLINDPTRQVFYIYTISTGLYSTFGGMGNAASWTPDSKTLYITDSAALGGNHTDTLYVYNVNTGWTAEDLSTSTGGSQSLAITIPSVGAYLSGSTGFDTVAHTWCPTGTVGAMSFYPLADSVNVQTDVLAATTDGEHILGATVIGSNVELNDIGVDISPSECSLTSPLVTNETLITSTPLSVSATASVINQLVVSPKSNLAFLTYTPDSTATGVQLPYYQPNAYQSGSTATAGTVGYVTLANNATITAPLAGAFTPDDKLFFVSTAGDNLIHYIDISTVNGVLTPTDTKQIAPKLPACTSIDAGCTISGSTPPTIVPATAIVVKPRTT